MDKSTHNLRIVVALLFIAFSSFTAFAQKDIPSNQTTQQTTQQQTIQISSRTNPNDPNNTNDPNNPNDSDSDIIIRSTDLNQMHQGYTHSIHNDDAPNTSTNGQGSNASSCPMMYTEVRIPFLQSCLSSVAHVDYFNHGNSTAIGAYVDVEFPAELTLDSASLPYTIVGTSLYRFQLGNVAINTSNTVDLHFTTACDSNLLGDEHCINAHIYPDTTCESVHDNYLFTVNGSCNNGNAKFTIQNHGVSIAHSEQVQYVIIEDHFLTGGTPSTLLQDTLEIGKDTIERFGFSGSATITDYRLDIKDPSGMILATSQIASCSSAPSAAAASIQNTYPNLYSNNTHLPFLAQGCATNGATMQTSAVAPTPFNHTNNNSGSTGKGASSSNHNTAKNKFIIEEETTIHVFPNPFNEFAIVKIEGPINDAFSFRLHDITGKTVQYLNLNDQKEFRIERKNLLDGMYFYQVESEGKLIGSGKVIIK